MFWRIQIFLLRLIDYFITIPSRFLHLFQWIVFIHPIPGNHKFLRWFAGVIVLIIDLTPVPFLYENILDLIKWKTRPMNEIEKGIAISIFGKKIPFHLISIDPNSFPAVRKKTTAYVSFHTINFDTTIPDATLIHELVHAWQYRKYGAVYITESIWAQKWGGGYNYGGLEPLKMYSDRQGLSAFNFEQQADIIEDYFRWKNNLPLQWVVNVPGVGEVLASYARDL